MITNAQTRLIVFESAFTKTIDYWHCSKNKNDFLCHKSCSISKKRFSYILLDYFEQAREVYMII